MTAKNFHIIFSFSVLFVYLIIPSFGAPSVTEETIYDQRQNGSENIRLHVNGIVLIYTPPEALVALAALSDSSAIQQQLMEIVAGSSASSTASTTTKTTTASTTPELSITSSADELTSAVAADGSSTAVSSEKPVLSESTKPPKKTKGRLRLSSLLMPFLRRL